MGRVVRWALICGVIFAGAVGTDLFIFTRHMYVSKALALIAAYGFVEVFVG